MSLVAGMYQADLLDEMISFPNGKYRDQVDACSGAFNRLISGPVYNLWGALTDRRDQVDACSVAFNRLVAASTYNLDALAS